MPSLPGSAVSNGAPLRGRAAVITGGGRGVGAGNSAGIATAAPIHKTTLDAWTRMLTVNATGPFLCLKAFLPGMVERGWGRVVSVATRETITRIVQTTGRSEEAALEAILQRVPQRRLIEPEEVAEAVAFLCCDGARGITGESLVIDGGDLRR